MGTPKNPFDAFDSSSTGQPSSATGVFGQVGAAPQTEEDLLASLLKQPEPEKTAPQTPPAPPAPEPVAVAPPSPAAVEPVKEQPAAVPAPQGSGSPGDFTRMLQALTVPGSGAGSSASPTQSTGKTEDVKRVFTPVAMDKTPVEPTVGIPTAGGTVKTESAPAGSAAPGSFTRMFSSMGPGASTEQAPASSSSAAAPSVSPVKPAASGSAPGEFTQMFSSMGSSAPGSSGPVSPTPAPPPAAQAPGGSAPGEFTQMFSAQGTSAPGSSGPVSPTPAPPPTAQSGPGAFTKMFASQGGSAPGQPDPLMSLKQEPAMESGLHFC